MEAVSEAPAQRANSRWVYVAFAALAVLGGPVTESLRSALPAAGQLQVFSAALAGIALLALGVARRQKMLDAQWKAVLVLLIPNWCSFLIGPLTQSIPWIHPISWGTALLLSVAAPLWLALLWALELVPVKVPRAVAGAAIAGVFAVCLPAPVQAYQVTWNQAPILVLHLLLNLAIVASWAYAAPRLAGADTRMAAGCYLLLSAAGDAAFVLVSGRNVWEPLEWPGAWTPLLLQAIVIACVWWLWFWLLRRMTLPAFAIYPLAAWAAALIPAFATAVLLQWRLDAAFLIALAAIVIALRARSTDEQPMALGLGET
jgi:hypothetical protein